MPRDQEDSTAGRTGPLPVDLRVLKQHSVFFAALDEEEIAELMQLTLDMSKPARQMLFRAGEEGASLYVVVSGRVKVSLMSPEGKEAILSILGAGSVVGEMSLLDGLPRSATVTTLDDCRFLVLSRRDFLPFLERRPHAALKLLSAMSRRLRSTNDLVENLSFLTLSSRLAKLLINLGQQYGWVEPDGIRIAMRLSQEELGKLVGASRESVNKQIRAWADSGLLEHANGSILLRQLDTLFKQTVGGHQITE